MEEPFDPSEEPFILKEVSDIRAINQLDDLVRQGAIENERAIYAKERYTELRNAYLAMMTTESTLKHEVDEMEVQLQDLTGELDKILKASVEDEETLELVREDAEQAESEAQTCKEKEQTVIMEVTDLNQLQELYKERILEIEKEHNTALAPLLSRYKLEITAAKDAIADAIVKKEQCTIDTEECKQRLQQMLNDIQNIHLEKKADVANLDHLEYSPEKNRKQADILSTAVKALQLQDQKWSDKVKEVEAEISGLQSTAKHLAEELTSIVEQSEKNRLLIEQKERQTIDLLKDLEVATLEVDDYLADQVNVDMQLRSRSLDVKFEQDQIVTRTREKDKIMRRLKVEENLVVDIRASIPMLVVERDKANFEVSLIENERKKVNSMLDELRKEIDLQMHNFLVVEAIGKEVYASLRASQKQVAKMELEVADCADLERLKNQNINNLTMMCERTCRLAVQKHHMWKDAVRKLHMMDIMVRNTIKRDLELEQQIKDGVLLYNLVRSQRNKFATLVQASGVSITEMKDKLITITIEVEALQNDVKYKDTTLIKQRAEYQASVRGRTQLLLELTKSTLLLRVKNSQAAEFELEVAKLEAFVNASEREMLRTRKLYGLEVTNRNQTGIALIDRNDELCILYEKLNVQVEVLNHSETELHKRVDEIKYLTIEGKHLQQKILAAHKPTQDVPKMYDTLNNLKQQLTKAKTMTKKLSDLVENPDNMSRWKLLPARDLTELELHLKMTAIDEFFSAKADQALEKKLILEEVTILTDDLEKQASMNGLNSREYWEKVNHYQRYVQSVSRQVMATVSELSLCQAIVTTMKEEKERLCVEILQAYSFLAIGEPPSKAATKEWLAKEREKDFLLRLEENRENRNTVNEQAGDKRKGSTAKQRPNAYMEEELGLPKPFGLYSPFKPSDVGGQMRHFKNPNPKPLEL
ncbi:unnamed protein product [Calypogeia fissa]